MTPLLLFVAGAVGDCTFMAGTDCTGDDVMKVAKPAAEMTQEVRTNAKSLLLAPF